MKALVCELCGSNDFLKQDGVFVCQHCNTKYTLEEAKKLMIDGVVQVQGTVKVDTSDELNKLLQAARNARETSDSVTAVKHYEKISAMDPNNWEALFYLVLLKTHSIKNGEIRSAANQISNCLDRVFSLIHDYVTDAEDQKNAVREVIMECNETAEWLTSVSHNFHKTITKGNGIMALTGITGLVHSVTDSAEKMDEEMDRCVAIANILCYCGNAVEAYFGLDDPDYRECACIAWKMMLNFNQDFRDAHRRDLFNSDTLRTFTTKVNKLDNQDAEQENGKKQAILTIRRNQTALTNNTNKLNRVVCTLIDGTKFELALGETATLRVDYGPNKISFEFWGQGLVPARNKSTPDFVVDGDLYIELTPDPTWGGFKTTITK